MQRHRLLSRTASQREAVAQRSMVEEQRRTSPPVNRERKGQTQQMPIRGIRRPQRVEPVASMFPLLLLLCTLTRLAPAGAACSRPGHRPVVHDRGHRDATRRDTGYANRRHRAAARRPTVNRAAFPAAVSALGSFFR